MDSIPADEVSSVFFVKHKRGIEIMKKSLFLCVFACFVLTRPVLAEKWITCEEAAKIGKITTEKAIDLCGIHYYKDVCYFDLETSSMTCKPCPDGYSGSCTPDGNCDKCYMTCNVDCNPDLEPIGCPEKLVPCKGNFAVNKNTTCTGKVYYKDPETCVPDDGECYCTYDLPGPYSYCPKGYRDCEITYDRDNVAPEEVCCKNLTGGTYVSKAGGDAVPCLDGYYCPGGQLYYNKEGFLEQCPKYGTSGPGSADITECYVPAGTTFDYEAGTGSSSYDCYYEK